MSNIEIDKIVIDGRMRRDMGDLESLAASIRMNGVLSPVLLTPDLVLVCGERRVRAARMAGLDRIPAHISGRFEDAAAALVAERDENTCRKEMTPSELLSIGQRLEELERPKAAERQAEGQRLGAEIRWRGDASISADIEASRTANPTNHAVADALGISAATYGRIKTVAKVAESDPDPEVRELATEALAAADAGEITISAAATRVREARSAKREEPMVAAPSRLAMPQSKVHGGGTRPKHDRVLGSALTVAQGLCVGLDAIGRLDMSVTKEEADRMAADLSQVIRSLKRIHSLLKEV